MVNTNRPGTESDLSHPNNQPEQQRTNVNADPATNTGSDRVASNRVPDMTEAGDHPVGTSVGAVGGVAAGAALGAIAQGAAIGSAAGPVGAVVGGLVGGVIGGVAGNELAEALNPAEEDRYWREQHHTAPYFNEARNTYSDLDYERDYRGAYEVGYRNRALFDQDTHFEQVEPELQRQWEANKGQSRLDWEEAKYAAKDAWLRATYYKLDDG
jgi:hypothetical protein